MSVFDNISVEKKNTVVAGADIRSRPMPGWPQILQYT